MDSMVPANNAQANGSAGIPMLREVQTATVDMGRNFGPRIYPDLPAQESTLGEYVRVLIKRKWTVLACLVTIFSLVAIASLKMRPIYEASGSIEINKPDSGLVNFNRSTWPLFPIYRTRTRVSVFCCGSEQSNCCF